MRYVDWLSSGSHNRLRPLIDFPYDRGLPYEYSLSEEHANTVFDIGRNSADPVIRSRAWSALTRAEPDLRFLPTLREDLLEHAEDDVRHSAARALTLYVEDSSVRADLERALAEDPCDCLQSILEPIL